MKGHLYSTLLKPITFITRNKQHEFCAHDNLSSHYDVVDRDVDELHEESNETHQGESDGCSNSNFLEFFPVRLGASLHQPDGILSKLSHWLHCLGDLIHCNLILCVICIKM